MARRHGRYGAERRPRRAAVFSLAALAVLGAAVWMAPTVAVLTPLRDRPLEAVLAGIAGSVSSGSARWAWLGPVEFRDVAIRDRAGAMVAWVPELVLDRGLLQLACSPRDIGTIRLVGPEAIVAVRPGGSSLEDVLAPWWARGSTSAPACSLEVVDGVVEFRDEPRGDAWRVADLFAAVALERDAVVAGWILGGRLQHAGRANHGDARADTAPAPVATSAPSRRIDRSTVAAGAAAALARDGGFSCSDGATGPGGARTMTVAAHRLPLGGSGVVATRCGTGHVLDGLAEIRLDVEFAPSGPRVEGTVETTRLALCRADTLAEELAIDSLEVPIDVTLEADHVAVRRLAAVCGLFRAEASGRVRLPDGGAWEWLDGLVADDFAVAADVDLAAVARGLSAGLVVRDDVRVTAGRLEIAAASRPDGDGRVLEVRAAARDLAAEQGPAAGPAASPPPRLLRWTEPFAAWLRARRGPAGGLRLDEARLTSGALEVTAAGSPDAATLQWTCDLGGLATEAAEVVDLAGTRLAGSSRGRVELARPTATGPGRVTVAANLEGFELVVPGRPAWRDEAISLEGEATGRLSAGAALVETAHAVVTGGDDRLEATVTGALVDPAGLLRGAAGAVRPARAGAAAADVTLAGDLARWHARVAPVLPAAAGATEIGGRVKASLAAVARGDAWEITRSAAEVERLSVAVAGRRVAEPRLVAAAEGLVRPIEGRIDVASAEVLTATLSLRTEGLVWRAAPARGAGGWRERLRGKVQWQADVGRLERWLVAPEMAARWPATGRAWGTFELVDGAAGLDAVLEATGSQLALAEAVAGAPAAPPRPVWAEPQATLALEVAVPAGAADRLRIERLALESTTLACRARGSAGGVPRAVELDGTVAYDWRQVSRLAAPWTGGLVQFAGTGGRPFALRGRLGGDPATPPAAPPPAPATLPLPPEWASAARAGAADEHVARMTQPVAARRPAAAELFRSLTIDTSLGWQAGDVAGFQVAPGEIPVRLVEGQLAFGPFDVGVSGGRVRGAPWLGLVAEPRELVVPGCRIIDRVSITGPPARRLTSWLSPLVGHAAATSGFVTVDLAGARLPLADPFAGLAEGRVQFDALEVTPDGPLVPLATLLSKLQALIDPRLALGDRPVLMRVRPDPVLVRLVERRLWHEGLVLDAGQFMVKSGGSVGPDGSLAMVVEVSLRADVAGQTPVVAQLLRTPLAIPIKGTVERPQFDARAIDTMLAKIVENTAQAVIGDGIVRGLDALLGGPQPPAPPPAQPPAPLVLPQGR